MGVRELTTADLAAWLAMRRQLWPEEGEEGLAADAADLRSGRLGVFVWDEGRELLGFAEVTMRSIVDGATTTPTGYLEGWWVHPEHRRRGIGRALVDAAGEWAQRRGASEMGSDSVLGNTLGEEAHRALGFEEVGAVTQWLRRLTGATPAVALEGEVSLRTIDADNVRTVAELTVAPHQRGFVAPNAISIAQASLAPDSWLRAVYAGEAPVGLVLLWREPERPLYYLWRFMIDGRYQSHGLGAAAMRLVIEQVRTMPGAEELFVSYVPLPGGPAGFYGGLGFVETGKIEHGEVEAVLDLRSLA